MPDPKKPGKGSGLIGSLIHRLKHLLICGNNTTSSDEESLVPSSSSPVSVEQSNVGGGRGFPVTSTSSHLGLSVSGSPAVSRTPLNVAVPGDGLSDSRGDPSVGTPETSLRQRHLKAPTHFLSGSSTPAGSIFTPASNSSPSSPASSSVSHRIRESSLGKFPAHHVSGRSVLPETQRLKLGQPRSSGSIAGSSFPAPKNPSLDRSASLGSVGVSSAGSCSSAARTPDVIPHPCIDGLATIPQRPKLPHGNIFPRGIPKGSLTCDVRRRATLGTGKGTYGYGSVVRDRHKEGLPSGRGAADPEACMVAGFAEYCKGNFDEAKRLYNMGIQMAPDNAEFRCNMVKLYQTMGCVWEAVSNCEVALVVDSRCARAHHLMGNLVIR